MEELIEITPDGPVYRSSTKCQMPGCPFNSDSAGWPTPIPVSERLPEDGQSVLMWCDDGWELGCIERHGDEASWRPDFHWDLCPLTERDTHWLPLPPAPNVATQPQPEPRE